MLYLRREEKKRDGRAVFWKRGNGRVRDGKGEREI